MRFGFALKSVKEAGIAMMLVRSPTRFYVRVIVKSHGGLKMLEQNARAIESCAICFGKFCNTHFCPSTTTKQTNNIIMGNHVAKNTSTNATMAPKEATAFIQHEISTHQVRAWRRSSCCIMLHATIDSDSHTLYIHTLPSI